MPSSIDLQRATEQVCQDADVPGIVVAVARGDAAPDHVVVGVDAHGRPLEAESLFPVASITKLATALTVLRVVEQGTIGLDDALGDHLPEAAAAQPGVTVRLLLCHTSGLPSEIPDAWAPYAPGLDWPMLARAALRVPLDAPPATRVAYSSVGYPLLALLMERRTGRPFAEVLQEQVLAPLGIEASFGHEPPRHTATVADIGGPEIDPALEPFNSAFWHSIADPAGGLVTTAGGAIALVRAFRGIPAGFLAPATGAEARRDQTGGLGGGLVGVVEWPHCPWGLGPMLHNPAPPPFTPALAGPGAFGHTGYSIGYVWASPVHDLAWAVFGTRTYNSGWPVHHGPIIEAAVLNGSAMTPPSS